MGGEWKGVHGAAQVGDEWKGVHSAAQVGGVSGGVSMLQHQWVVSGGMFMVHHHQWEVLLLGSVGKVEIKMRKKGGKVPSSILTFYLIHHSY